MHFLFGYFGLEGLLVVVCFFLSLFYFGKRLRKNHGRAIPPGFERTEEVSIDPVDGKKRRVYYNPRTGERYYHEEEADKQNR